MTTSMAVRDQILDTASELFYQRGVHAVGVDVIIAEAGVAKSSLYRHFRSKDDLIAAYVKSQDEAFWRQWDHISALHHDDRETLIALVTWIGQKIASPGYRGCPQLNIVAEFPDPAHPAREVATHHKNELRRRLRELTTGLDVAPRHIAADQIWLLIDGAFANHRQIAQSDPVTLLVTGALAILTNATTA